MCLSANFLETKRNPDFLLEAQEASDVQDLATQPQPGLALARKQNLPTSYQRLASGPGGAHIFVVAKLK